MPSQNMLPKGKRRQSVRAEYRAQRTLAQEREAARRAAGEIEAPEERATGHDTRQAPDSGEQRDGQHLDSDQDWDRGWDRKKGQAPSGRVIVTTGATGSKVAQEVASPRRYAAPRVRPQTPEIQVLDDLEPEDGVRTFTAETAAAGLRLDAYLAKALPEISRARVVLLIDNGQVTVDGMPAKGKQKLKGGELIEVEGEPRPAPLHAEPEDLPLTLVYEDNDLAVVDKAAGMMVHAGSGAAEHNRGTLVNALLHHFGKAGLSEGSETQLQGDEGLSGGDEGGSRMEGGPEAGLRPGIVHRLDKQTSGLLVVAKNDLTHHRLGEMFSQRRLRKVYLALVHGWMAQGQDEGTITLPISRDLVRRTRMTTRRAEGRSAVTHWKVLERIEGAHGRFTLLEVRIETGRTHQIRVHMQALGHPVVGDFLYGAPHRIVPAGKPVSPADEALSLDRNFLHAAELAFAHPRTGKELQLHSELPAELLHLLEQLRRSV